MLPSDRAEAGVTTKQGGSAPQGKVFTWVKSHTGKSKPGANFGEVGRSISSYGKDRGRCFDEAAGSRALPCTRKVRSNEVE